MVEGMQFLRNKNFQQLRGAMFLGMAFLLTPQLAFAHLVSTRFGEFYSGLLHPLTTLVHLVPWIAFGLVAGSQSLPLARKALLIFPLSVFIGVLTGSLLPSMEFVSVINILTFIAGLAAALAIKFDTRLFVALLTVFGLSHGIANGLSGLSGKYTLLYSFGVCVSAYVLITIITAISHLLIERQHWGHVAVRALGSWIVAVGLMYGGYQVLIPG